jgi:hypothetical protein
MLWHFERANCIAVLFVAACKHWVFNLSISLLGVVALVF